MSFVKRLISVSIQLAPNTQTNQPNTFAQTGADTVTLSGSRTSVRIQNSGAAADNRAQVKIWGMTPSLMNELATLGMIQSIIPRNVITISAGDETSGMSIIFRGTILAAYGDYSSQPDVPFQFECLSGAAEAAIAAPVSSFPGSVDVATIMSGFARGLDLSFENNGVSVQLSNPYFTGSLKYQAQECAEHAGIEWGIINGTTLAIWPRGGNRNTPNVPVISPATGMIDYPAFTSQGIIVKTLFNPQISFGSLVKVESTLLSGIASSNNAAVKALPFPTQWAVKKLDLALDSLVPKGDWMSIVYGYSIAVSKTIVPPAT